MTPEDREQAVAAEFEHGSIGGRTVGNGLIELAKQDPVEFHGTTRR